MMVRRGETELEAEPVVEPDRAIVIETRSVHDLPAPSKLELEIVFPHSARLQSKFGRKPAYRLDHLLQRVVSPEITMEADVPTFNLQPPRSLPHICERVVGG